MYKHNHGGNHREGAMLFVGLVLMMIDQNQRVNHFKLNRINFIWLNSKYELESVSIMDSITINQLYHSFI